jgi:hypothetical protein
MSVFIITYDLHNPGQNYETLIKQIKSYGTWARLGFSCYLIKTNETVEAVRDNLLKSLDQNDKIYVGLAPPPSAWYGMTEDVSKWIHTHQK